MVTIAPAERTWLCRYYLDARQPQPASEANRPAPVKEAEPEEAERGQPVDAQELLREAEEQAGDQVWARARTRLRP